ncbi:unnamed protein product [Ectocarpus fasciculatus]
MLAVVVPGAQRVLARHAGHSQRPLGVIGRCRDCAEYPRKVPRSSLTAAAAAAAAAAAGGEARCPAKDYGPWSARGAVRRLSVRPESSRSSNPSSSLGLGVGAILAMGGLLLATQGLPNGGNPAAMEAEGGRGGRHGDDHHASFASSRTGSAAASHSEQHSAEETDENRTTSSPPAAPAAAAAPDPEPDSGGVGGGGAPPNGDDGGGEEEEEEEEFPAEGRYRFYILTPEEAAAEGRSALDGFAGRRWDGYDEDNDDERGGRRRLKERYHFVVIGGGTTADAAMESILRMRPEAEILCLSDETPRPADDGDTHTGSYEADFRLLKTDLAASFNQWRRHLAFREETFANGGGGGGGGGGDDGTTSGERGAGGGKGRSAYGLSKGKGIRYHTYEPHDLIIEPERRCVRLLLDGMEVYYDKCLIANAGARRERRYRRRSGGSGQRNS